jgi:predicted transcriptional regulator
LETVVEAGEIGITAQQVARKLGEKRETVSHYLWVLKKAGKITNVNRNLWVPSKGNE